MGCGTGPLTATDRFKITLQFDPVISPTDKIYANFKDAMLGFLQARFADWEEGTSGGDIDTVTLAVRGPIETEDELKKFNRAMNRMLWGVRVIRPGDDDSGNTIPSGFKVKVTQTQLNSHPARDPDWRDEETG
jgi:hypothetical protein